MIEPPNQAQANTAHGELILSTVAIVAAKIIIPVIGAWLLNRAPPKPRKETIVIEHPDGRKITRTLEYSKQTNPLDLEKMLADAVNDAESGTSP